jgi:hypothetical protein
MLKLASIGRAALQVGVLTMTLHGLANAASYDFKLVGGGNIRPAMVQAGGYICLDVMPGPDNTVNFTLRSLIAEPYSRLVRLFFDVGVNEGLIVKVSPFIQSPNVKFQALGAAAHPFIPNFSPKFVIGVHDVKSYHDPRSIRPGQFLMVSATLGPNKTFADVVNALNVGMNPATATAAKGLRVGVIASSLLGKKPEGVGTLNDDAGFVVRGVSARCQGR